MSLFDNDGPEEFSVFVRISNMTTAVSGTLETGTKVKYLRVLVCGEALRHFDLLSSDVESTEPLTVEYIINGLSLYFPPVHSLSK